MKPCDHIQLSFSKTLLYPEVGSPRELLGPRAKETWPLSNSPYNDTQTDICNYLNKHFTSITNKVITFPSTDYKSETLGSFVKNKVPDSENFCIKTTNEDEVPKLLCSLDSSRSAFGPDGIKPKILKIAATIITKSLAFLDQLKEARVTPLFKDGFADDPNNYRPISVLPTISKLFEKVVSSQFYDFLSRFKLLHGKQSGFRPKHSCQTDLLQLVDSRLKEIENGNFTGILFFRFPKGI